jgi:hypothetical protein
MEKEFKLSLELINEIVGVLGELPAKNVYHLLAKIYDIVKAQAEPKEE